jgi:hypothetical protein
MPFPFIPGGLALALAVLGGTMALFGLALKALDWSIDSMRRTVLPGIVSGIRDWQRPEEPGEPPLRPAIMSTDLPVEESGAPLTHLERVEPDRRRGSRDS